MNNFIATLEKKLMPLAKKIASEKHLKAIRDTFMTILPPIFFGGIIGGRLFFGSSIRSRGLLFAAGGHAKDDHCDQNE